MAKYEPKREYWQVKTTGEIMICPVVETRSPEWHQAYRRVRLLRHEESECVFLEDFGACLSALDDPSVVELDIDEYNYWKMIYDNPDI